MQPIKNYFTRMRPKGACPPRQPLPKIIWSWLGAFVGIYALAKAGEALAAYDHADAVFLIGSFGASAVLAYGAPLAEFSQPRNLVLGHVVSAIVGVAAYRLLPNPSDLALACAVAVACSVAGMHLTRSLHPPGGATALIAVIGGEKIHAMGFAYVLSPVLIGAIVLLLVAIFTNNLSRNPKRHYPLYWF